MAEQLWKGRFSKAVDSRVNDFNSSIRFDQRMIAQDMRGSGVHAAMLAKQGIISEKDCEDILNGLASIADDLAAGRLERALRRITMLQQELDEYYARFRVSNNLLELRNLVQVAELIVRCAMLRKESRGLHYTLDYPQPLPDSGPSILSPLAHIKR